MIRLVDSLKLARTKLKTHRLRTALTILIASLLFGVLFFVLIVSSGIFASLSNFSKTGLTSRYIANGSYNIDYSFYQNEEVMEIAKRIYEEELVARKAEAKRLGLDETMAATSIQPPVEGEDRGEFRYLNMGNPLSMKAVNEYISKKKEYTADDFIELSKKYNPKATYKATAYSPSGSLEVMKDGKESLTDDEKKNMSPDYKDQPIFSEPMSDTPDSIIDSYILKNNTWRADSGRIPVVISQMRAEQLLGVTAPAENASAKEKLDYTNKVRQGIVDHVITVCYRNNASTERIQEAIRVADEKEKNRNNADYQEPPLQYGLPSDDSCGAATILKDTRSASEKDYERKLKEFESKFSNVDNEPKQEKVEFQVVGLAPNPVYAMFDAGGLMNVRSLLSMILMNNVPTLSIPSSYLAELPEDSSFSRIYTRNIEDMFMRFSSEIGLVEFNTSDELKNFIDSESCKIDDMTGACREDAQPYKPFVIQSFGSNSAAIDDFKQQFMKSFLVALGIMMALAVVILGFTISRAIADGRRETAVFRAIGFKRMDIASVYLLYSQLLALLILVTGFVIGLIFALIVDGMFWVDTTSEARLAFGYSEQPADFRFIGFDWRYIALVAVGILIASFISSLLPLIRNVRRNPIRDMRDE